MKWFVCLAFLLALCGCGGGGLTQTFVGAYTGTSSITIDGVANSSGTVFGTVSPNGAVFFQFDGTIHGTMQGQLTNGTTWPSDGLSNLTVSYAVNSEPMRDVAAAGTINFVGGSYTVSNVSWVHNPGGHQATLNFALTKN